MNMIERDEEFSVSSIEELSTKYDGKTIEYTAVVSEVTSNLLFEGIDLYGMVCLMDIENVDEDIKLNMKITVRGTAEVQDVKVIYLNDCTVEKIYKTADQTLDATDFDRDSLSDVGLDIFEISGEVTELLDFNTYQVVRMMVNSEESLSVGLPVDIDLSSYSVGDDITVMAVWDGMLFHGYAID